MAERFKENTIKKQQKCLEKKNTSSAGCAVSTDQVLSFYCLSVFNIFFFPSGPTSSTFKLEIRMTDFKGFKPHYINHNRTQL